MPLTDMFFSSSLWGPVTGKYSRATSDESPTADCTHPSDVTRRGATDEDCSREEGGTTSIEDDCTVDGITAIAG